MTTLPAQYDSFLAFSAIFFCMGFAMFFLRKAAKGEIGPGYWTTSFFLNSAGFLFWAATVTSQPWLFYVIGEALHMLGFITLLCGAYRFTGNDFRRSHFLVLGGFVIAWSGAICLLPQHRLESFLLLMVLRAVLFLGASRLIFTHTTEKPLAGRRLTAGGLLAWGIYVLAFPFIWKFPFLVPMALGFLVGFHVLVVLGLVVMIVDRMRLRAEVSEQQVKILEGCLPICSYCKKIRDEDDHWNQIEMYIRDHSEAEFTHSICPNCAKEHFPELTLQPH
ncbi:MAG: hypothetical protein KJ804_22315 [Proteobacteria bacterium]|nr:hypothetical protein [Pseudomonadota bacterium]MBU1061045.1 hypothetical protein [Pseudomonadota bacterium]